MDDTDSCFEATRRVRVCANGGLDGKEMQLLQSWDVAQLITAAAQRLGIAGAQVAYNADGIEIDDASLIETGDIIFISDGSPFLAPGRGGKGGTGAARVLRKSSTIGRSARMRKDGTTPNLGVIGGYRVGRVLGEGGFGAVRLGVHTVTGEQVAMKFLNKGGSMSAAEAERVATEIACLSELEHPNVIRLVRVLNEPDFVVIVLDYAPGGDLKGFLQSQPGGRLSEALAREKFLQVVKGVAAAHAAKIVHRDLKLENVLLAGDGSCRITDFGLSAYARPGELTRSAGGGGSLFYLAPEVVRGTATAAAGTAVDCWCLGVMLFALLTGRLPFRSPTLDAIEARLRSEHAAAYAQRVSAAAAHSQSLVHVRPVLQHAGSSETVATGAPSVFSGGADSLRRPESAGGPASGAPLPEHEAGAASLPPPPSVLTPGFGGPAPPPPIFTGIGAAALLLRSPLHGAAPPGSGGTPRSAVVISPAAAQSRHGSPTRGVGAAPPLQLLHASPSTGSVGAGLGGSPRLAPGATTPLSVSPAAGAASGGGGGGLGALSRHGSQPALVGSEQPVTAVPPPLAKRQPSHGIFPLGLQLGAGAAPRSGGGTPVPGGDAAAAGAAGPPGAVAVPATRSESSSSGPSPPRGDGPPRPLTPRDYAADAEKAVTTSELREIIREVHRAILGGRYSLPDDVPPAAADLVRALLHPDPALRATLQDAMHHPWVSAASASSMLAAVGGMGGGPLQARAGRVSSVGSEGGAFRGPPAARGSVPAASSGPGAGLRKYSIGGGSSMGTPRSGSLATPPSPALAPAAEHLPALVQLPALPSQQHSPALTPLSGGGAAAAAAAAGSRPGPTGAGAAATVVVAAAARAGPLHRPSILSIGGTAGGGGVLRAARRESLTSAAGAAAALSSAAAAAAAAAAGRAAASGSSTPLPAASSTSGASHHLRRGSDAGGVVLHPHGTGQPLAGGRAAAAGGAEPRMQRPGSSSSLSLPPPTPAQPSGGAGPPFTLQHGGASLGLLPALGPPAASAAAAAAGTGGAASGVGALGSPTMRSTGGGIGRGIAISQGGGGTQGGGGGGGGAGRPSLLSLGHSASAGAGAASPLVFSAATPSAGARGHVQPQSLLPSHFFRGGSTGSIDSARGGGGGEGLAALALPPRPSSAAHDGATGGASDGPGVVGVSTATATAAAGGGAMPLRTRPRLLSQTSDVARTAAAAAVAAAAAPPGAATAAAPPPAVGLAVALPSPRPPSSLGGREEGGATSPVRIASPLGRRRLSSNAGAGFVFGVGGAVPQPPQLQPPQPAPLLPPPPASGIAALSLQSLAASLPPSRFTASDHGSGAPFSGTSAAATVDATASSVDAAVGLLDATVRSAGSAGDVGGGAGGVSPFADLAGLGDAGAGEAGLVQLGGAAAATAAQQQRLEESLSLSLSRGPAVS